VERVLLVDSRTKRGVEKFISAIGGKHLSQEQFVKLKTKNGYCFINKDFYASFKSLFGRRRIRLPNGLWATVMRLDDPLVEDVAEVAKRFVRVMIWHCLVRVNVKEESVYFVFTDHNERRNNTKHLAKELKSDFNKVINAASFIVYENTAHWLTDEFGLMVANSIKKGVSPKINVLINKTGKGTK